MSLFDWFANRQKSHQTEPGQPEREIADGLWSKCDACGVLTYTKDLQANQMVCPECAHHNRVYSDERIRQLIDANTWSAAMVVFPIDLDVQSRMPSTDVLVVIES